jgi:hypothetical protein
MTTISVLVEGNEPVLLVDGARVAPESLVTLPADAIARLAHANLEYGRRTLATEPGPYHRNRAGFRPPEVPA